MEIRETAPEAIKEKIETLVNGGFRFGCHPGAPCFTECCRDLNLQLTPYDLVRLKNRLCLSSGDFLDRFTVCRFEQDHPLPAIFLQMDENERKSCPFVSPKGCTVYADRPSACRVYPLARASRLHRVHGRILENYFILHEDHCLGFQEERFWKMDEWLEDQGLQDYNEYNDLWMAIVTHPKLRNAHVPQERQQMFYLAAYDSDRFREMVINSRFLSLFRIDDNEIDQIRTRETALLKLAFKWIQFFLLGEGTLKPRTP
jgi:hypothetical protein